MFPLSSQLFITSSALIIQIKLCNIEPCGMLVVHWVNMPASQLWAISIPAPSEHPHQSLTAVEPSFPSQSKSQSMITAQSVQDKQN